MQTLDRHERTDEFIRFMREADDSASIDLDFSETRRLFPNSVVPFAAAIDFYHSRGHAITSSHPTPSVGRTHVLEPMLVTDFVSGRTPRTNNVWKYRDESEAQILADLFIDALVGNVRCEDGVVDSLNWCLYEVMDNVFQHSRASDGLVMMQIHKKQRLCAISVADTGIGIQKSLIQSAPDGRVDRTRLGQAHDAIGEAIRQGVTSKGKLNQGNGLFGLQKAVATNGGMLSITSGRGRWSNSAEGSRTDLGRPVLDPEWHHATAVDWQLDCSTGELEFRRRIFVENASPTNRSLIERAIAMRLSLSE